MTRVDDEDCHTPAFHWIKLLPLQYRRSSSYTELRLFDHLSHSFDTGPCIFHFPRYWYCFPILQPSRIRHPRLSKLLPVPFLKLPQIQALPLTLV